MVLFDNVYVGQRVEVLWNNGIYRGTVQFRGTIATRKGEWVGVALELPVGDSNGMLFARRYFQCPPNHGVFVRSDRLRFIPSMRCLFDRYHSVSRASDVEEFLFDTPYYSSESVWEKPKHYHLRHSVSNHIPAATMLRPGTAQVLLRSLSRPIHADYWKDDDFERKPTIPKIHMPHSALKEQVRRGWQGAHYVREMTVPTGRDKIKFSQWNDISP
ncbi:unnamed protein product [Candidula unifasciata]|uniref:CAP-Gly domain-containing protein n=1 Tax=Candidula unifasciata TaxID=100452 RepID=A0A8S3YIV5_9EUPU|nr:unnamed protein product [Candidula unifasciata]